MGKQDDFEAFKQSFDVISKNQKALREIYDETIDLINDITNRSRTYMIQISDVEDGLFGNESETKQSLVENLDSLTKNIRYFNKNIETARSKFARAIQFMIEELNVAIMLVSEKKGNKNELKRAKRVIRYLAALIRKFKVRITQLQLMNNVLFAFSQEMKLIQDEYKKNLRNVNTEMTSALEQCDYIVKEIDNL